MLSWGGEEELRDGQTGLVSVGMRADGEESCCCGGWTGGWEEGESEGEADWCESKEKQGRGACGWPAGVAAGG